MIHEYDRLEGVPKGHFFLVEILSFGDFEVKQEEAILFHSDSREELVELCKKNGWELNDKSGWNVYYIGKR